MIGSTASSLEQIDWSQPWLAPWREHGLSVAQAVASGLPLHAALNRARAAPVQFVPQSALPPGEAYERYIFNSGQCPTREGLHDFFNGLCWMRFPETKTRLNRLQAAEISDAGIAPLRGPVRDALTVFDENAGLLLAPQPLWDALIARDWRQLLVGLRPLWRQARLELFGHALLEKLVYPRKPMTVHVYRAQPAIDSVVSLDSWVATDLNANKLAGKPFTPLPVLGVPGWWPQNEPVDGQFPFYDDPLVFRPRRLTTTLEKPAP